MLASSSAQRLADHVRLLVFGAHPVRQTALGTRVRLYAVVGVAVLTACSIRAK
ncbi:hypothetical protein ACWGRF_09010 [Streptomyces zhihengii]